jgi:2-polyprenyl-6-methoxyphenol hydroxylase-like FAD-dependent oxidoreductase
LKSRTVLISGIGIAGPTLAFWLARHGFEPTLIERAPALRTGGYMIDFWGLGFDVAERMGLIPALRRDGYDIQEVRLVDCRGRRVSGFGCHAWRSALDGRFFSILRGDLARQLYGALDGKVDTIFGDSVQAIDQAKRAVHVRFERTPPRRFDVVIGADGLHSNVRQLTFGSEAQFERFLGYYTASFLVNGYPHRDEGAYVAYSLPGKQVARYSLRGDRTGFLFVFRAKAPLVPAPHDAHAQKALLQQAFSGAGWECPEIIEAMHAANDLYFDAVSQIRMAQWSRGRVALVGDACFCPSLLAGQGAAFAMAGVYLLAGELNKAAGDPQRAFANYQRAFQPFIERKQRAAKWFGGWLAPKTNVGIIVRNQLTRLFAVPPFSKRVVARMFSDRFSLPNDSD